MAVFAPLTSIITTFFDCKAMTPYNHAFLIVGGFPCWEEVKFVIFTVDHQVAPQKLSFWLVYGVILSITAYYSMCV